MTTSKQGFTKVDVLACMRNDNTAAWLEVQRVHGSNNEADIEHPSDHIDVVADLIDACKYMKAASSPAEWARFHKALSRATGEGV